MKKYSRVYASVNLDAICNNLMEIKNTIQTGTKIVGVIKTDGYGHGAIPIGKELEQMDFVWGYATATVEEACILRRHNLKKPVLILGHSFPEQYETIVREGFRPNIYKYQMAEELSAEAVRQKKMIQIHIKIDTGMNRLGLPICEQTIADIMKIYRLPNLEIEGIFTHFVKSDEENKTYSYGQIAKYQDIIDRLETEGINIPLKHCANSAGLLDLEDAQMDLVRAGISLYGLYPSKEVSRKTALIPAMELKSTIIYLKKVAKGESVSYGATYVLPEDEWIATIPVGYGDGYPSSLSNKGYVLIHGQRAPIRGKVCMDQFMVDVTGIEGVKEGDEVTLFGFDKEEFLGVEELSELSGRFVYEFICDLGKRIPRVYLKNNQVVETIDTFDE
ncbi:MAG: alanine racemase [Lachnospiraceae bacterium]